MKNLFVYGTLMSRYSNHRVLPPDSIYLGKATLPGFSMVAIGRSYPGIVENDEAMVKGEVYMVPDFKETDRLEGYNEKNDRDWNHYLRENVKVQLEDTKEEVWAATYVYNRDTNGLAKVPGGDWRAYNPPRE